MCIIHVVELSYNCSSARLHESDYSISRPILSLSRHLHMDRVLRAIKIFLSAQIKPLYIAVTTHFPSNNEFSVKKNKKKHNTFLLQNTRPLRPKNRSPPLIWKRKSGVRSKRKPMAISSPTTVGSLAYTTSLSAPRKSCPPCTHSVKVLPCNTAVRTATSVMSLTFHRLSTM